MRKLDREVEGALLHALTAFGYYMQRAQEWDHPDPKLRGYPEGYWLSLVQAFTLDGPDNPVYVVHNVQNYLAAVRCYLDEAQRKLERLEAAWDKQKEASDGGR
jgi:hypothetical protein